MFKILIVDDEPKIRELVLKYGKNEGHTMMEAEDGYEALSLIEFNDFDLLIVDLMMPNMDGFSLVKRIREDSKIPIIMLTARGEEIDKFHGFDLGVDDYVVKPFSPKELMYRIHAILNRTTSMEENYVFKDFNINFSKHQVSIHNQPIALALKEYDLLTYLIKNKGFALTRDQILNKVWGFDFYGDDRTLDTHIKRLRKKLGDYGQYIITIRGVGYRFDEKI